MKSIIKDKTYAFALDVIALYKKLTEKNEYVISRQLLKSGTSIGANVEEALAGQSRPDFLSKMSIASKEARETNYWLRLLRDSNLLIDAPQLKTENSKLLTISALLRESEEISKMLTAIVKTTKCTLK